MASKNYEVIFQFRAALDSSMGQIRNVSDDLEQLRERHAALQETLAEAENFQQYQQNVADAAAKVQELKTKEEEAARALENATAARKAAQEEVRQHDLRITQLRAAIRDENAAYNSNITLLREAKATEKEIQEEKIRHQAAVESLKKELGQEEIALKQSKAAKDEAIRAEREAEAAKKNATAATKEAEQALQREKEKLQESADALRRAGINTDELDKAIQKLNGELRENSEELAKAEAQQKAYAETLEKLRGTTDRLRSMRIVTDAIASAAKPVWTLMTDSLQSAAALEKRISAVKAVSGATVEETELLTRKIRETGATTVFTAEEAADAMERMALAGWDAQQMIAGLPAVVNLAAAAGEELADMTSIVADGMNAFGLSGERAAVKFADVLAKAATSSNTNVGLMGDSLSYVETTAGNLGYSIEDVSIALAAMANNALKGSVAGSALNTMLTRMSGANSTAADQMDAMGISMYDAVGQAKPLAEFMDELRAAFRNFGDDAQAAQIAAYRLAGQRGMRGLLALVNQSDEQWKRLTTDIYNYQGAADQISTDRLENYSGKVQLLKDAFTDLKITLGNQVLPAATDGVEVLTDLTGKANELAQTAPGLSLWATGTSGAILGMSKAVGVAASAAQNLYFIMKMLPAGTSLTSLLAGLAAPTAAVALLGGLAGLAVASFSSEEYQNQKKGTRFLEAMTDDQERLAALRDSNKALFEAALTPGEKREAEQAISDSISEEMRYYEKKMQEAAKGKQELIDKLKEEGRYQTREEFFANTISLDLEGGVPNEFMTDAEEASLAAYDQAIQDYMNMVRELSAERKQYHEELTTWYEEESGLASLSLESFIALDDAAKNVASAFAEVWEKTYTTYSGLFGLFEQVEVEVANIDDMISGMESQYEYAKNYADNLEILSKAAEDAGIEFGTLWNALASQGDVESAGYIQAIVDSLGDLQNADTSVLEEIVGWYDKIDEERRRWADVYSSKDNDVLTAMNTFDENFKSAVEETNSYDEAKTAMTQTLAGFTDGLDTEDDRVILAVQRFAGRIRSELGMVSLTKPSGATLSFPGYAKGTENALPGMALVGEQGPELLVMKGGETVLNHRETQKLLLLAEHSSQPAAGKPIQISAYAKGTENALPGMALVGEQGPELLVMKGGETVLNHRETQRLLLLAEHNPQPAADVRSPLTMYRREEAEPGGSEGGRRENGSPRASTAAAQSGNVTYAPQITIQGNADRDVIDEALEASEARFMEWWEKMQRRQVRTAY